MFFLLKTVVGGPVISDFPLLSTIILSAISAISSLLCSVTSIVILSSLDNCLIKSKISEVPNGSNCDVGSSNIKILGFKDSTEAIATFFATEENIKLINCLKDIGIKTKEIRKEGLPLQGKKFVFTGGLTTLSRPEASDLIKQKGRIIASSVSKDIDYVIVGDKPGSKYDKAKKLNLTIINEDDFKKLVS